MVRHCFAVGLVKFNVCFDIQRVAYRHHGRLYFGPAPCNSSALIARLGNPHNATKAQVTFLVEQHGTV